MANRKSFLLWCALAGSLSASAAPGWAQLGQSQLITPGSPDAEVVPNEPDIQPGKGWMPPRRFQSEPAQMSPMPPMSQQQPMPGAAGPQLEDDGSMPWVDLPKRSRVHPVQQPQQPPPPSSAFQTRSGPSAQDAWSLPSAQQQQDLGWAQNLPDVPMSAVTPTPQAKPGVKPQPRQGQPAMKTLQQFSQNNANALQPTTQFNPDAGFPSAPMNAGMPANQFTGQLVRGAGTQMNGGMPMGSMNQMNGAVPSGFTDQMNGGMPMGSVNPMNSGFSPSQPAAGSGQYGMMMSDVAPPGSHPPPTGGMSPSAMAQMQPFAQLLGLNTANGGMSSPFDAIGKAIAGFSQMGIIPSSGAQGRPNVPPPYNPQSGMYNQAPYGQSPYGQQMYPQQNYPQQQMQPMQMPQQQMPPMQMPMQMPNANQLNGLMNGLPKLFNTQ